MGFHVEINSILRSDDYTTLKVGEVRSFYKTGSRIFFDDIPIWLTRSDWTALAEIQITSQTRVGGNVKGEFQVLYIYASEEQLSVTNMFRRLYADSGSSFVYLLMSESTLREAMASGSYSPSSLQSEGFVHAAPSNQLTRIANKYYIENETVFVLKCRKTQIQPPIKWEPATGGLYPHIYGALNMNSVEEIRPFFRNSARSFEINL